MISNGTDGYVVYVSTYNSTSNSQTTVLIIPAEANKADAVYTCVIQCDEHGKTAESPEKTDVELVVSSEGEYAFQYIEAFAVCFQWIIMESKCNYLWNIPKYSPSWHGIDHIKFFFFNFEDPNEIQCRQMVSSYFIS